MLRFFDPVTENYLRTHEEAEVRAEEERADRIAAESRADTAESRLAEVEAEL